MALTNQERKLLDEISALVEQSRRTIYAQANSVSVLLFWKIGQCINNEILYNKRTGYGKQIVVTLSRQLTGKDGRSFIVCSSITPHPKP